MSSLKRPRLQFGLIDGVYQGAAALAGLTGGLLADRWNRHRALAAAGYALSVVRIAP